MKGVSSKDDKAKPQNGIAETGSKNDIGAGTAQKMTYIFLFYKTGERFLGNCSHALFVTCFVIVVITIVI